MSATGRGAERLPDEAYCTPAWCVRRLLEEIPSAQISGNRWLDPCAGDGAIVKAVHAQGLIEIDWTVCEIRDACMSHLHALFVSSAGVVHGDFFDRPWEPFDVAIANPPFSTAQRFIDRMMQLASTVIVLQRVNYASSEKRCAFMREFPPEVYVLPNRPSFTGGGTDATEYAWFVWRQPFHRDFGTFQVLKPTPQEERRGR